MPESPEWLVAPDALAVLGANAESAGRDWSFGWVLVDPDAPRDETAAALTGLGVEIEGQTGSYFRARLPGESERLREISALPGVVGLGAPPPSAKLPASFAEEARGMPAHEVVPVFVTLAAAGDADGRWRAELERLGAVVGSYDSDTRSYVANVAYGIVDAVAAADFVAFVEPVSIVEAVHDTAVPAMGADAYRAYAEADGWMGTAGENVAVGVMDTGLNINHVDIGSGRRSVCGANFIPGLSEELDLWVDAGGHGTHVTGTVAGNGAAERRYAGMAPLARHIRFAKVLHSRGYGVGTSVVEGMDFLSDASSCSAAGWTEDEVQPPIVNMSLSWTTRDHRGRGVDARKLDAVVWNARQLYVVSNANSANRGFSNYAAAKTSLSVGNARDSGELAGSSSHGPTADGRLAPMVVGTGVSVISARGDSSRGGYRSLSGTSMSSPAVAGVAALLMDAQPVFQWKPALARAYLMSSAIKPDAWLDTGSAFPADNTNGPGPIHDRYGLGKVSGTTSMFNRTQDDGWSSGGWYGVSLDTGETTEWGINVPPGASRLDVVLTWDEPPADVIANTVLNDLDLWLDAGADCGGVRCGEHSSRSRRDNVEWVIVKNPQPGRWRSKVVAERVYGDKPRAALAYTIIRGPATPQLSIVADSDTLGPGGEVTLTVSTDGYVAAGTRLSMDCRTADDTPCQWRANYERVDDGVAMGQRTPITPGQFISLGEIRTGSARTLRFRGPGLAGNASLHFTVTGWNAAGDSAAVFADEVVEDRFAEPANDDFSTAAELEDRAVGDLLLATTEPGEPPYRRGTERPAASVWYRWKAQAEGPVHFTLEQNTAFQSEMRVDVFQGESIAGGREVASAPWGASFIAERGREYMIRVSGQNRAAPFTLSWREGGVPDNDAFDAGIILEGDEGQVEGTNAGATLEPGEVFGPFAATVWYSWTAPDDGWYEFRSTVRHLKVLAFEDGSAAGDLRLVSGFPKEVIRFPVKDGDTYRIAVASAHAETAGTEFELSWSTADEGQTSNDLAENATVLPDRESSSRSVSFSDSTTIEPEEPPVSGVRTAWWSWSAPETDEYTWRLNSDRATLAVFKGDELADLDLMGTSSRRTGELSFHADQDQQYRFAVGAADGYAFTARSASGRLTWGPTPANNAWSGAEVLTGRDGTVRASNRFATVEQGERIWDVGHSSLWWSFEAPAAGWYRFWIDETGYPFTLSAYSPDDTGVPAGRLEMIASSQREVADGIFVFVYAESAGERIVVRVGTEGDSEGSEFTLRWEETDTPVWLRYAGRSAERYATEDEEGEAVEAANFKSLALDASGEALYAVSDAGLAVFERNAADGSLEFFELLPFFVDDTRGDSGQPVLWWDESRKRLLAFDGCSVRSYTPVDREVAKLEDGGDVPVTGDSECAYGDRRVFADSSGEFLYLVELRSNLQVFSVDEDGALTHVQTMDRWFQDAAISNSSDHIYAVDGGSLLVLARDSDTGELSQVTSLSVSDRAAVAVSDDDSLVFLVGESGAAVIDVADPERPSPLGTIRELLRERSSWWARPNCAFAVARDGRTAADAFCRNGSAYAIEWRSDTGEFALTDHVAAWRVNRYNDVVPSFRDVVGFAASPDGLHAYAATPDQGILAFERGPILVEDDHGNARGTATAVASLPSTRRGTLETAADRDVFRVDVASPGTLVTRTTGSVDTFGTLTEADGTVVAEDDDSGTGTNFRISADVKDGRHYIEVRAADDRQTGDYRLSIEFTADEEVPAAPTGLAAAPGDGEARLTWTAADDGGSAVVRHEYRTRSDGGSYGGWARIPDSAPGGANATSYTVTGLDNGERTFFQVRAVNAVGPGEPSNEASATPEAQGGADSDFSDQRIITTDANGADSVFAADLDGDGDPDVLSASLFDDKIAWHENLGGGEFSNQRIITTEADSAASVFAADLDGDGDADVLSASIGDDRIAWHENLGDGEFSEQRTITADDDDPNSVAATDLDGDGDADVLLSAARDDKIAWHENLGGGEFSEQRTITTDADNVASIVAADLDGDGDPDVLSASRDDDKIAWHENLGGGEFSEQRIITTDADGADSVFAADLDGDGDPDVLSGSTRDDKIAWYENLGGGQFSAQRIITTDADGADSVFAADVDGDGDPDVLSASRDDDKIAWHENLGGGGFSAQRVITTDADSARSVFAADLDGDGDPDVLSASLNDDKIAWYENLSDHGDDHGDASGAATGATALPAFLHGNLESAGDRDVFRVVTGNGRLRVWSNGPTDTFGTLTDAGGRELATDDDSGVGGNFEIETRVSAGVHYVEVAGWGNDTGPYTLSIEFVADGESGGSPVVEFSEQRVITTAAQSAWAVHAADLDGDGDADVLSASLSDDKIAWHENLGGGTFSGQRVITNAADGAWSVHAADLDGDSDADVLSASDNDDKIAWHENQGGGRFSEQRIVTTDANSARSVHAADLDGDGDADVLSAAYTSGQVAWHENQGGGEFSEQRVIAAARGALSVHAADLDGDGDADVLTVSSIEDKIVWHENLGGGTFSEQRVITTDADNASFVHAADLDGDGDADVLSASILDDKIAWHENLGGGMFSEQRVLTTAADHAWSVHASDLDGDGDVDVLSASRADDKIAWYENLGDGTFSEQRVITTATDGAQSVHAADLDGDGDSDVLSASYLDNKIAWYENLSNHGDDHGDAPESATLVTAFPAFLHGVLETAGDRDVFRFATGSGTLRVSSRPDELDTAGRLMDASGRELASDDDSGELWDFAIEANVAAGVHYVEVRGVGEDTGSYTLSIEFEAAEETGPVGLVERLDLGFTYPRGITYANDRLYLVSDGTSGKVYAYDLESGQRDTTAEFELDDDNQRAGGIAYASGRFHVVDWEDNKVYAYRTNGQRDAAADFNLDEQNGYARGIAYSDGRFYLVDEGRKKVFAYSDSGQRDASADFDLGSDNAHVDGIVRVSTRFFVVDDKVYAYSASGERDTAADFELHADNSTAQGITHGNGRFYVADYRDRNIFVYAATDE